MVLLQSKDSDYCKWWALRVLRKTSRFLMFLNRLCRQSSWDGKSSRAKYLVTTLVVPCRCL